MAELFDSVYHELPRNVPLIAEKIAIPPEKWAYNCHGVSIAWLSRFGRNLDTGRTDLNARVRRGYTTRGYGGQHSWIELEDGTVVDPTLYATMHEGEQPMVEVFDPDEAEELYDPCGWHSIHGEQFVVDPPDFFATENPYLAWDTQSADYFADLVGTPHDYRGEDGDWFELSIEQAHWLAHLPVLPKEGSRNLGDFFAREAYEWLESQDLKALIPIDAWHYVMDVPYPGEPERN
jgi:hypothetical protein